MVICSIVIWVIGSLMDKIYHGIPKEGKVCNGCHLTCDSVNQSC